MSISIFLGSFIAFCTAVFVISLNVTLVIFSLLSSNIFAKCHAIASPSRSGSVAKYTVFAFFASVFNDFIKSPFPRIFIYSGSKLCSISTPNFFVYTGSKACSASINAASPPIF